jgi:two-component system, NarL family, invasion response regulator UvrY
VKKVQQAIKLLVCDDHEMIVMGLQAALRDFNIETVAGVRKSPIIVREFIETKPDVVLLDVRFESGHPSGFDVAKQLREIDKNVRIVFYSQFDTDQIIKESYRLGGSGFVTKHASTKDLADAINRAFAGRPYFLPDIAERLAQLNVLGDDSPQSKLDKRELFVFERIALGDTIEIIAAKMKLSKSTVAELSKRVRKILGVTNSASITLLAVKHALILP